MHMHAFIAVLVLLATTTDAILASPLNTKLFNYMQSLINVHNHSAAYFIGTRANRSDEGQEVQYVSVEGKLLDDMPDVVFEAIEQLDIEQGDCLSMDRRGIRAVSCWDHLPYICYSNNTIECGSEPTAATPTPGTSSSVPPPSSTTPPPSSTTTSPSSTTRSSGYTYQAATGSWYKYHKNEQVTWNEAQAACKREGGHLVVVNDAVEAETVRDIMRDGGYGPYTYVWIGLRDNRPGGVSDWRTVSGQSITDVYHEWKVIPSPSEVDWTCAVLNHDKLLYTWSCAKGETNFICESSPANLSTS